MAGWLIVLQDVPRVFSRSVHTRVTCSSYPVGCGASGMLGLAYWKGPMVFLRYARLVFGVAATVLDPQRLSGGYEPSAPVWVVSVRSVCASGDDTSRPGLGLTIYYY